MKLLVDECLHTSLVGVAERLGHAAYHVNWLGLSGETDRALMRRIVDHDLTFVTNNASNFRKLYARHDLHAGLIIVVPQVAPAMQRAMLATLLDALDPDDDLVNEVIEMTLDRSEVVLTRSVLPARRGGA